MAWYAKYRATLEGRGSTWTIDLENDTGSDPGVTTIDVSDSISIVWGNPESFGLGPPILSSYCRIQIFDDGDTVFGDLDGADEDVWRFKIYDGTYTWYGHPRLDTLERKASSTTGVRVLDLYAYDRLKLMDDNESISVTVNDSTTGFTSLHQILKTWLYDNCQELNIVYVMGWFPGNMNSSGVSITQIGVSQYYRVAVDGGRIEGGPLSGGRSVGSRADRLMDRTRSSRSVTRSEGSDRMGRVPRIFRAVSSMVDNLESILNAFLLRVYQSFDGKWIVAQRFTIGEAIGSGTRVVSLWNGSTAATSSTTASTIAMTDGDISEDTTEVKIPRPNLFTCEQNIPHVEELNIIKDASFEESTTVSGGESPPDDYWFDPPGTNVNAVLNTVGGDAYSGSNSVKLPYDSISGTNPAGIKQYCIWVDEDSKLSVGLKFYVNFVNNTGGSLDVDVRFRIGIDNGPFLTSYWWDGSAWQTSEQTITKTKSSVGASSSSGWEQRTYASDSDLKTDPFPGSGLLWVEFLGDVGNDDIEPHIDHVEFILLDESDPVTAFSSRYPIGSKAYGGEISHARPFANLYNFQMMTETAASTWKQIAGWDMQEPTWSNEYWDLFQPEAVTLLLMHISALKCLRGSYFGILTPNDEITYGGSTYVVGEGLEYNLKDHITKFSLAEKQHAFNT